MSSHSIPDVERNSIASDDAIFTGKESPDVTIIDEDAPDLKASLQQDPEAREAFLA